MNADYFRVLDEAMERMFAPRTVREVCHFCDRTGINHDGSRCAMCDGGYTSVEPIDREEA